jgi:hypothetical protein
VGESLCHDRHDRTATPYIGVITRARSASRPLSEPRSRSRRRPRMSTKVTPDPSWSAEPVEAATTSTSTPKFRWQTSATAAAFAGLSLADIDGSRVLSQTSTWLI